MRKASAIAGAILVAATLAATGANAAAPQPDATAKTTAPAPDRTNLTVEYDTNTLPAPVKRLREQILEAAHSGDIERLRPILDGNGIIPTFTFGDGTDPIAFWKEASGDGEGREILAIMIEVFEAGFVLVKDEGQKPIYVWPYFAAVSLEGLTPPQQVELYELVTAQDVVDMKEFGAYIFYRAGITPDGQWQYFVAGD